MRNCFWTMLGLVAMLLAGGCAGKSGMESFLREGVDLGFYERIAVLPFENNSADAFSATRMRDITTTQVLAVGGFDVVDKGVVDSVLQNEAINKAAPIDMPTLVRLGKLLNVKAFLMGTVDLAGEKRKGAFSYPEISLTLRLIDAGTGDILWQASGSRNGYSLGGRLIGLEPADDFQVAMKLVDNMLATGLAK